MLQGQKKNSAAGLLVVLVTAFGFYGFVYFVVASALEKHTSDMEEKFYTSTCRVLIESGWEVEFNDCIEKFKEAPLVIVSDDPGVGAGPADVPVRDTGSRPRREWFDTAPTCPRETLVDYQGREARYI